MCCDGVLRLCCLMVPYCPLLVPHFTTATRLCEACASDVECDGWALLDNVTGTTYRKGKPTTPPPGRSCTALVRVNAEWINVGGDWVSTPGKGECRGSAVPGDGTGCSWMLKDKHAVKYINQSCTALSGSISTVFTVLSWICVGRRSRRALPSPVCA